MSRTIQQEVADTVTDEFLRDGFGQLDLSGLPGNLETADDSDPFAVDERFGGLDKTSKGFGSVALKKGLEELALESGLIENPHRPREFNTHGFSGSAEYERGFWRFQVESAESDESKTFKIRAEDYETAAVSAARYLSKNRVNIHTLTKDEELYVIRLAQRGQLEDAVNNYISYSLPGYDGDGNITAEPRYQELCTNCAWFIFKHSTPQFQDGPEVREFMTRYVGDRPANVEILRFAFAEWNKQKEKSERGLLLNQIETREAEETAPTYEQLDELDTEEISRLREATLRHAARQRKAGVLQ